MTNRTYYFIFEWLSALFLVAFAIVSIMYVSTSHQLERTTQELEYYKIHSTLNTTK